MNTSTEHPKVFISYSWTTVEHEQFVVDFATSLRSHGVDAVLDKWDLKPGNDKFVFMESMVLDLNVQKVLVICDRKYQEKANARLGGVGTESQIISQELYGKVNQTKFIPVICECDDNGLPCLPVFMKGLMYIDVSSDERYGEGMDSLLRLIYEQPYHEKPKLGSIPSFVSNPGSSYVKELGAALRAIQEGRSNRNGLEALFLKGLLSEVQKLYSTPTGQDYDETIFQSIGSTKTLRDQFSEYAEAVSAFSSDDPIALDHFIKFMEGLGSHFGRPVDSGSFYPGWADIFRFFALEMFLIKTAALLRHGRWKSLKKILGAVYVIRTDRSSEISAENFSEFDRYVVSLDEHRNRRLKQNRASVTADMLKERCSSNNTTFPELMEADIFLMLSSVLQTTSPENLERRFRTWSARTAVYTSYGNNLRTFLKAADQDVRRGIHFALGVNDGTDLRRRLNVVGERSRNFGRDFGYMDNFNFLEAINIKQLERK